jgi:hypothetical protein
VGEHVQPAGRRRRHPAAQRRQRLLEVVTGLARLAELLVRLAEHPVPAGPLQRRRPRTFQRRPERRLRLPEPPLALVQPPQPHQVGVQPGRVGVPDQPVGGRPRVLHFGVEARPAVVGDVGGRGQQRGVVLGVPAPGVRLLRRVGGQPLGGVLAEQLVHAVAAVLADLDQGVVEQAVKDGEGRAGDRGGRLQVEAAARHRKAREHLALLVGEQFP